MSSPIRMTVAQRRARLVSRHRLGGGAKTPLEAVRGVAAMHSSDPATPYLGLWARVADFQVDDLDAALHEQRSLWRLHAMRRTLFVVATDEAPAFQGGASQGVARTERRRLEGWIQSEVDAGHLPAPASRWLAEVESRVLDILSDGGEWRTQELTKAVPELATQISLGSGKWAGRAPVSSRILFLLALEGRIARTRPTGSWRSSQYLWADASAWFGVDRVEASSEVTAASTPMENASNRRGAPPGQEEDSGAEALLRLYLATHGPATLDDIRWWMGWTKTRSVAALEGVRGVAVELVGDGHAPTEMGFVLPEDADPHGGEPGNMDTRDGDPSGGIAFLPSLDPTPMGWRERRWYLGPHGENGGPLFDRNGNVGPTVWADGRVVGGWAQTPDGTVAFRFLEPVGPDVRRAARKRAKALTDWLGGVVVTPRFPTPLARQLAETP